MANRIFLQDVDSAQTLGDYPLLEDVTLQFDSEFKSFADDLPMINEIVDIVQNIATLPGTLSTGMMNLRNLFDAKRWKSTSPVILSVKLLFFTKDKPKEDVFDPIMKLCYYSILSYIKEGGVQTETMQLPGISLQNLSEYQQKKAAAKEGKEIKEEEIKQVTKSKGLSTHKNKLVSVEIPGVIYLDRAMITKATPTFSKEITESGYPLWGNLEITIESLVPANSRMLEDVTLNGKQTKTFKPKGLKSMIPPAPAPKPPI